VAGRSYRSATAASVKLCQQQRSRYQLRSLRWTFAPRTCCGRPAAVTAPFAATPLLPHIRAAVRIWFSGLWDTRTCSLLVYFLYLLPLSVLDFCSATTDRFFPPPTFAPWFVRQLLPRIPRLPRTRAAACATHAGPALHYARTTRHGPTYIKCALRDAALPTRYQRSSRLYAPPLVWLNAT